jgi:dihydropteroate synthase
LKFLNLNKEDIMMGILNLTPDSFSDGGNFDSLNLALEHAKIMLQEGADIIDIGGESTRPGSTKVSKDEELERIKDVVQTILNKTDAFVSVDTYKWEVAKEVLKMGVPMINDIWGLQHNENMAKVVAEYDAYIVIMHNQDGTDYKKDIIDSMIEFFNKSIQIALNAGIDKNKIILDPGIGFGKTTKQNMIVINRLEELNILGYPILLGTSRKSIVGNILDLPSNQRLEGTIATNVIGALKGCNIFRVHDVKENLRAIKVAKAIKGVN